MPTFTAQSESDTNVSHDSDTSLDDQSSDRLDSLGAPCHCPCGLNSFSHIFSPLPDCLAMRHSRVQNVQLTAVTSRQNKKEAKKQMEIYFSFETEKLRNEFENFGYAVYLYARSIRGVENILKQILRLRGKVTDSNDFELLYNEVTSGASPIDYEILSSLFEKLVLGDINNDTELKKEANIKSDKYLDAFRKFAQHRVFSASQGDLIEERPPIQDEEGLQVYKELKLKVEEDSQTFRVERIPQLKCVVKKILNIPECVQLRVVRINKGCVEISFEVIGSFDFDLNLDQRQDLISNNITLLEYAGKVHYCCCELLQDEVHNNY